ncbi:MAG: amino acid permease [bacterium]
MDAAGPSPESDGAAPRWPPTPAGDLPPALAVPPTPDAKVEAKGGEVRLAREITLADATLMGIGALMGGGVFVLLGLASSVSGNGVILALILNGFVTIPTLMVYADLGAVSDDAGGGYLWVRQALGRSLGFLGGWLGWFSHVIACSLYALASAAFIFLLVQMAGFAHGDNAALVRGLALFVAGLFLLLNYLGVKIGIKAENVINSLVLVAVTVFIGAGLWHIWSNPALAKTNLTPFFKDSSTLTNLSNVFLSMGIMFIAFEGYEIIAQTGEEIQNPRRNVPRAHWYSFLVVWAIMLLIAFIALAGTRAPVGQAWSFIGAQKELGLLKVADQIIPYGTIVITGAALLLQITALNATIYSSSRVSFAMGRLGDLPRVFGRIHKTRRTPHYAVLGSGVLILTMALLPIETVATAADVMFLLLFLLVNTSYIKLRKVIPAERFGKRAPFFPYLPMIGIFTKFFLAIYLWKYSQVAWYVTGLWIAIGMMVYFFWVKRREPEPLPPLVPLAAPLPMASAGPRRATRILVLLSSPAPSTARGLAKAGGLIAQAIEGEVVLLHPILVPEVTPLSEGQAFYRDRSLIQQARAAVPADVPSSMLVRIGHSLDALVREVVAEEGATLLLMSGQARLTVGQPTSPLLAYPPCDVAVLRLKTPELTARRVLVAGARTPSAPLGIRLATALARGSGGKVTLFHVLKGTETAEEFAAWGQQQLGASAVAGVPSEVGSEAGQPVRKVLDKSRGYDLVVVGASAPPKLWSKGLLGPKTQEITDRVAGNVLIVRSGGVPGKRKSSWLGRRFIQVRRYVLPE